MFRIAFCLAIAVAGLANVQAADQPNFVVIFIDDMGYGDIGPYGSKLNRTPNLDRMADEGMKLTSFYAAPVCSASRAQLLTGCYAPRVSVPGVFFPAGPKGLSPDEITVAEYLKELGYATTCVGKWHLGDQPEFLPTNQGFDHYFGIPYSNDMQRVSAEDGRRVTPLLRDDRVAELLEDEQQRRVTREYTEEAVKFIEQNKGGPFFLYLPHTAMHVPLFPHQDFAGKSGNGTYGDWVQEVDWSVGQVLDALRKHELDENTLVIFTSDNGPWASKGKAGGVSGPLRGSKGCTLEGGVREPTICWWPGTIKAGSESKAICGTTDVLPTLVSLAGGSPRANRKIDGVDLSPILQGERDEFPNRIWHYYRGTRLQAVRRGAWKLAIAPQSIGMGFKSQPEDISSPGLRLYNLEQEIGERTNVAADHPDVVRQLQSIADRMLADIGSGKPGPGVRPPGLHKNPVTLYPTKDGGRKKKASAKTKPIDWTKIKVGDSVAAGAAPNVAGKPFRIECQIDPAHDGVIVAHGGSAVGYSLYVNQGVVYFAIRYGNNEIVRLDTGKLNAAEVKLETALRADKTATLSVNGRQTIGMDSSGLLPRQPQEDFCVGHDNKNPLDDRAPRERYGGTIKGLKVIVDQPPTGDTNEPRSGDSG